jgi:hypothetical protein
MNALFVVRMSALMPDIYSLCSSAAACVMELPASRRYIYWHGDTYIGMKTQV